MSSLSTVEVTNLEIKTDIGTYKTGDVVPSAHILDLFLVIDSRLVLIEQDGMDCVFDYDPLIAEIDALAQDGHYETQERLITRIIGASAKYQEIQAVEVCLRKTPVLRGSGDLGVRIKVDAAALNAMR